MICTNKYSYVEESSKETCDAKRQKVRCMSMLEEALCHVTRRLPSASDAFESLSNLSPVIILNQISKPMFSELPFIQGMLKKDRTFAIKTLLLILHHFKHCPLQSSPLYWLYTVPSICSIFGMLPETHFL